LDVACYADGKVEVYRNLGNGAFELVWEKWSNGVVQRMEWRKTRVFSDGIPDISSWADLHMFYAGRHEVISHKEIITPESHLASVPNVPPDPSLDFREVWRSQAQTQPVLSIVIDDIDNDGRTEVVYKFVELSSDTVHLVVYECIGDDSLVVDWDTSLVRASGPFAITDVDRDGSKELVLGRSGGQARLVLLECLGPGRYRYYETNVFYSAPPFKALETDIDHDGIRELCLHTSNPTPLPGQDATFVYVAEFSSKDSTTNWFNIEVARHYWFTFDMAVGQVDGVGRDEIVLGGSIPNYYLWFDGVTWITRRINTGYPSSATAPMFVNLDADTTLELFIGGIGPIGHGSCYALDYVSDTTWTVLWADSSLRNTPLSVNAGMLEGEFVVAGANTVDRGSLDTLYTDLHVYQPSGVKLGIWRRDTASVQNFHFLDIDNDGRTNLVAPLISHLIPDHLAVYEYYGTTDVGEGSNDSPLAFQLFQNYPNPFNPTTEIKFDLPETGNVLLVIYDLLGRQVVALANGRYQSGYHSVTWNASSTSSGVYFARFSVTNASGLLRYSKVNKLVLMR